LYQKCCDYDFSSSSSQSDWEYLLKSVATDTGLYAAFILLMAVSAVLDAVMEVEVEVREQDRLRMKR
jgi:hypothetical protein